MSYRGITLDMVYEELLKIRNELQIVENALIPVEKLSASELKEHKKALEEAQTEKRINFRELKG
ncbi:MAG: hypothetical protein AB1630_04145 [bacterium]